MIQEGLLTALLDDLLRHVWWDFLIVGKLHRAGSSALRHRADVAGVAKHVCQWHNSLDELRAAHQVFHCLNAAPAAIEVANDITHEFLRCCYLNLHHWLEQDWVGLLDTFAGSQVGSQVEGELA